MSSSRREFLAAGVAGAAGLTIYGSFPKAAHAAPEKEIAVKPALICVYLRGGQDALNTLVPYTDGRYYDIRPNIAVPPPDKENGAIDLDGTFGLNPGLSDWKKLWDQGLLAPIVNAGLGHPSRSHFACQDFMEFGHLGNAPVRSGWLNRFLTETSPGGSDGEFRALALQSRLPRSMRGKYPALAVAPSRQGRPGGQGEDVLDLFDDLYKQPPSMEMGGMREERPDEDALTENGRNTIESLRKLEEILATKPEGEEVRYPASAGGLGQRLQMAARLLKSGQGVEVIGIDWNGWDHHINEGGSGEQDTIRRMLSQMGLATATFMEDVKHMRNKVCIVIMTEFGRTNRENGNLGTDHGHGGNMYLIGGKVNGGRIHGEWAGLDDSGSYQNRDLAVTTDWRRVLGEVLQDHMKLHPSKNLFPKWEPPAAKMGLFKA
jgi:uncharacterized protein (DUF1501 family)